MTNALIDALASKDAKADECRQLYLQPTEYIDWEDEAVLNRAALLAGATDSVVELAKATFEFVRDEVAHSYDVGCHVPAAKASDVLKTGASICWGKANLLAALLRANGIPSGISYQVLTKGESAGSGYMIHALNTAYLEGRGWIRLDARGNKEGVDAQFSLTEERLAYRVRPEEGERDLHNNCFDADFALMGLIESSIDIFDVSWERAGNE